MTNDAKPYEWIRDSLQSIDMHALIMHYHSTGMLTDAVIHAHKSVLIGAATFAKLVKVCDPNDQLDQLSEYIGYTVDECTKRDERDPDDF